MAAFTKILKNFDKVSNQQASASYLKALHLSNQQALESYLKAVKILHFISSDKVVRLMDEVEAIFTKQFANDDKKKAMKFVRPQQHRESHYEFALAHFKVIQMYNDYIFRLLLQ